MMARCHQRFFIGQGNVLSRFNGSHGGTDSDHPYHRRHQDLISVHGRDLHEAVHAGNDLCIRIPDPQGQVLCLFFVPDSADSRLKFPDLLLQEPDIASRRNGFY